LVVRGRVKGDIERVFPGVRVITDHDADYRYRAMIAKHRVAARLFDMVAGIDYCRGFKGSVVDKRRAAYYFDVWDSMYLMQEELSR